MNNSKKINALYGNLFILVNMRSLQIYSLLMGAILMLCTNSAAAADGNTVHIRGQGCAEVSDDSLRSSARIKATDKAAFAAVSNLERLAPYKAQLDPHDFNVLVYTIVDEYLEDTDIKSTAEGDEVCAQMEGYVSLQNIDKAVDDTLMRLSQEEQLPDEMPEKAAELSAEISEELDKIQQQQQAEQLAELEDKEVLFQGEAPKASGTVVKVEDEVEDGNEIFETPVITPPQAQQPAPTPENNTINTVPSLETEQALPLDESDNRALVFVRPVTFFDNTQSAEYAQMIKDWFAENNDFLLTDNEELANFVLTPKVLRAKTEPINNETNRLQMVISLEMKMTDNNKTQTEHQNRFVLYENSDNEQQVAYNLMKKLFTNAVEVLAKTMLYKQGKPQQAAALPSIITPTAPAAH